MEEEAAVAAAAAMWWLGALEKDAVAVEDATRVAIIAGIGFASLKGSGCKRICWCFWLGRLEMDCIAKRIVTMKFNIKRRPLTPVCQQSCVDYCSNATRVEFRIPICWSSAELLAVRKYSNCGA